MAKKAKKKNAEKEVKQDLNVEELTKDKASDKETMSAPEIENMDLGDVEQRCEDKEDEITLVKKAYEDINDKYLRLQAEFDNYRKRTLREKMELTKTAGESILLNVLPVMDDFERGIQHVDEASDINAVKEGMVLIQGKFNEFLQQNGVRPILTENEELDTDLHEAITKIPAPSEDLKGKIVDCVQKGYFLNDKVIRFAKVVIGE